LALLCTAAVNPLDFYLEINRKSGSDSWPTCSYFLFRPQVTNKLRPTNPLSLNCLNHHYAIFWSDAGIDCLCRSATLPAKNDPRLSNSFFHQPHPHLATRLRPAHDYMRRQALVEIDVLVARPSASPSMKLITILTGVQFPGHAGNTNANTWYDQNGRIVFHLPARGLTGVGLPTQGLRPRRNKTTAGKT